MPVRQLALPVEVAEYLRVDVKTLRQWRWLKKGPKFHRLEGGGIRYDWSDVEAYVKKQAHGGAI